MVGHINGSCRWRLAWQCCRRTDRIYICANTLNSNIFTHIAESGAIGWLLIPSIRARHAISTVDGRSMHIIMDGLREKDLTSGLVAQLAKIQAIGPLEKHLAPAVSEYITISGIPVGSAARVRTAVDGITDNIIDQLKLLDKLWLQMRYRIAQSCCGVVRMNHLLRALPGDVTAVPAQRLDTALVAFAQQLVHGNALPVVELSATDVHAPVRFGGLGLQNASRVMIAARLGCLNGIRGRIILMPIN